MIRVLILLLGLTFAGVAQAQVQPDRLDQLFAALATAGEEEWEAIEEEIWVEWSSSGSSSMDLLLERGRQAIVADDTVAAIGHLTALVDHAPDFAEGWNARATAYFKAGLYGPSLADIARVLALEPRHFGALAGLGFILEEIGEAEAALEAYRKGGEVHPKRTDFVEGIDRLELELQGQAI